MTLLKNNAIKHFAGLANGKPTYIVITCLALLTPLAGTLHAWAFRLYSHYKTKHS